MLGQNKWNSDFFQKAVNGRTISVKLDTRIIDSHKVYREKYQLPSGNKPFSPMFSKKSRYEKLLFFPSGPNFRDIFSKKKASKFLIRVYVHQNFFWQKFRAKNRGSPEISIGNPISWFYGLFSKKTFCAVVIKNALFWSFNVFSSKLLFTAKFQNTSLI